MVMLQPTAGPGLACELAPDPAELPINDTLSVPRCRLTLPTPCGTPSPCGLACDLHLGPERHALLELGTLARLAIIALPGRRGTLGDRRARSDCATIRAGSARGRVRRHSLDLLWRHARRRRLSRALRRGGVRLRAHATETCGRGRRIRPGGAHVALRESNHRTRERPAALSGTQSRADGFLPRHPVRRKSARRVGAADDLPGQHGIGTSGTNVALACMALDSRRRDVFLLPLENPQQTPAYDYPSKYSPHSPKFSRAMAVVQGHFVSTLVSGTASIVDSKTVHPGDILRQTEQTLDNIQRLIAPENFARHGLPGAGATLRDIAKLRVYVKRAKDYEACREVCERRLPRVPAIYLHADICRSDLLVEIETVAFSPLIANAACSGH